MQVVAVGWQVYLLTHSALALGLIGLMQALPRLLFSLVGGVLADVLDRRKMLLIVNLVMMIFSAILALCTNLQMVNLVIIYLLILLSATASSFEFPTRLAIIPHLVPRKQMADALSLDSMMVYLLAITGPTAGGFALAWLGIASTYWLNVVSYLVVIAALFVLRVPPIPAEKRAQAGLEALGEGMRFLRAHQASGVGRGAGRHCLGAVRCCFRLLARSPLAWRPLPGGRGRGGYGQRDSARHRRAEHHARRIAWTYQFGHCHVFHWRSHAGLVWVWPHFLPFHPHFFLLNGGRGCFFSAPLLLVLGAARGKG